MKIEYSDPPQCDICHADVADCWPPENKYGYTGLCEDCYDDFYEENKDLFKRPMIVLTSKGE